MLDEAVRAILSNAVLVFSVSPDESAIKSSNCKHKGAQTGYNERDGSWMAPCPTCGDSR